MLGTNLDAVDRHHHNGLMLHKVGPVWVRFIQGAVIVPAVLFASLNTRRKVAG